MTSKTISYSNAIQSGFCYLLDNFEEVFVLGQGLWSPWYVGQSMRELEVTYGRERIMDTPVSEQGSTGVAIGASLCGYRPIIVHPRIDFMLMAMDQIVNQAAKWSHMLGADCDVLVARDVVPEGGYNRILVPTDFSEVSDKAIAAAATLVNVEGEVELFHAWQMPGGAATYWGEVGDGLRENIRRGALEFGMKSISGYAGSPGEFSFSEEEGDARHALQKRVDSGEYDLVVMGTHGRRGLGRMLLGSVTESTIRHTKKSVYLVR